MAGNGIVSGLDVLVSGASIAGPALAFWLRRAGHRVTVVERARELRGAGQNVDVRGAGREVLRLMGLEDIALQQKTGELGIRFVDDRDALLAEFPAGQDDNSGATAQLEVLRGALSSILVDAAASSVDYEFGDQIAELTQRDDKVDVAFAGLARRRFDLVVVCEGTRSSTRTLVFGQVPTRRLGLYTAFGSIDRRPEDDHWWTWFNAVGGRSITVRPDNVGTTRVALSFLSAPKNYEGMAPAQQRDVLRGEYAGVAWKAPRILDSLATSEELYVDDLTQIHAPDWVHGRVVLLGDAAWCATPVSGMGTTLALTGAYVLAGELSSASSVDEGLSAYQAQMRPMVGRAQKLPPGAPRIAHPKSRAGLTALRAAVRVAGSRPVRAAARLLPAAPSGSSTLPRYQRLES
jgi:2-polyprenyl-6-methoxyphenol hydroxylase-like FAD-dependent oxidoreductase